MQVCEKGVYETFRVFEVVVVQDYIIKGEEVPIAEEFYVYGGGHQEIN